MNRGIARRTVFETRECTAWFLRKLEEAVDREDFEVHAFCLMTTHFHILLRSKGGLSEGMRRVENEYVRWFNRQQKRDGPLFRGRFKSKLVESTVYRRILVRYIDYNPVRAGLVTEPWMYPHGSAGMQHDRPCWLSREWLRDELASWLRAGLPWDEAYRAAFGQPVSSDHAYVVDRDMRYKTGRVDGSLDNLVEGVPARVRSWMMRKAHLADGTRPGSPVVGPESVGIVVKEMRREEGEWRVPVRRKHRDGWQLAWIALLREACAMSFAEIAAETQVAVSTAHTVYRGHRTMMVQSEGYARRLAELGARALRSCHEGRGR